MCMAVRSLSIGVGLYVERKEQHSPELCTKCQRNLNDDTAFEFDVF
jgi:hypothetical protein